MYMCVCVFLCRKYGKGVCRAVHGEKPHAQMDVEQQQEKEEEVLTFVKVAMLPDDTDEGERLARYLDSMEECIQYHECEGNHHHEQEEQQQQEEEGRSKLVVSKKTTLQALPSTYLKDLSELLRNAKYNIKPLLRKISGDAVHPPCMGSGEEVLLQGFNWDSSKHHRAWYEELKDQVDEIADYGFTLIWLPPSTDSVSPEGYMPRDLYSLDSRYGSVQELMEVIAMFQSRGVKVLGDAVINHRCAHEQNEHGVWNQFGGGMKWDERAIVKNDPNFHGRGNLSSGALFEAAPNIDHSQDFVKSDIGEWLVWMRTHVGFDGWRFDFVKGFHGSHLKDYLEVSKPYFSVGEYWDTLQYDSQGKLDRNQDAHRQRIVDWIHSTNSLSCAFDMTTKGILHAVFGGSDYARLADHEGKPAGFMGFWPSRAVTFLENHDTGSSQGHWRFPHDALEQGYAYILTHPGTPCVFYDHIFHNEHLKHVVRRLIALRKEAGISCRSRVEIWHSHTDLYVARIEGRLVLKLGPRDFCPDTEKYRIVDRGYRWAIWRRLPDVDDDNDDE